MSALPSVIIDNDTHSIKAGLSSSKTPQALFPTKSDQSIKPYIGEEINADEGMVVRMNLIQRGQVCSNSWDNMEALWTYAYNKIGVESANHIT